MVARQMKTVVKPKRMTKPTVRFATRDEGRALFDQRVRARLGISGATFLKQLDRGAYRDADPATARAVADLKDLIPFVRIVRDA